MIRLLKAIQEIRYNFSRQFGTYIPDKEIWKNGAVHLVEDFVQIFSDGSKLNRVVSVAILRISILIAQSIRHRLSGGGINLGVYHVDNLNDLSGI